MNVNLITAAEAVNIIRKNTKGSFFRVIWKKKDGTVRSMLARTGAWKMTHGGKNTTAHIPKYMTLWSVADKGFRNVNVNEIMILRACGQQFLIN